MIKVIKGRSILDWEQWVKRVLTPPLSQGVKDNPEIVQVLEAFEDLIQQVKEQNTIASVTNNRVDVVYSDLLAKQLDKNNPL